MSRYKGTLRQLNVLKGKITHNVKELKAYITDANNLPEVTVRNRTLYQATWTSKRYFAATLRKMYIFYRFCKSKITIAVKSNAKLDASKAGELKAEEDISVGVSAPLVGADTKSIKVNHSFTASTTARLVAYYRGVLFGVKWVVIQTKANLTAVKGAVAEYRKKIKIQTTANAKAADSAVCESRNNVACQVKAAGSATDSNGAVAHKVIKAKVDAAGRAADTAIVSFVKEIKAEATAAASAVRTFEVSADAVANVSHNAKLVVWADPVLEDGVLYIRSVYSATQTGDVLEVS